MSDRSHAEQARDRLRRIETGDDAELEALRAAAVDRVDALLARLEATPDDEPDSDRTDVPESWDDSEWADRLAEAREKAALSGSKGTVTTKTIDGRDYYYLQWREGDDVKSQYIAPVDPA